jgi:hypothetical protein
VAVVVVVVVVVIGGGGGGSGSGGGGGGSGSGGGGGGGGSDVQCMVVVVLAEVAIVVVTVNVSSILRVVSLPLDRQRRADSLDDDPCAKHVSRDEMFGKWGVVGHCRQMNHNIRTLHCRLDSRRVSNITLHEPEHVNRLECVVVAHEQIELNAVRWPPRAHTCTCPLITRVHERDYKASSDGLDRTNHVCCVQSMQRVRATGTCACVHSPRASKRGPTHDVDSHHCVSSPGQLLRDRQPHSPRAPSHDYNLGVGRSGMPKVRHGQARSGCDANTDKSSLPLPSSPRTRWAAADRSQLRLGQVALAAAAAISRKGSRKKNDKKHEEMTFCTPQSSDSSFFIRSSPQSSFDSST